jgi:hypothetical protein
MASQSIEPIDSEILDAESSPPEYEISTYPADFTLQVLYQQWQKEQIVVPLFQRQFVWKQPQASKLIESFLLGLPVPPVYFYTERKSEKSLVIDGQQRLKSIFYFFEGFFGPEDKGRRPVFRLTGLNERSRWAEKTYADLEADDEASALKLQNSVLRAFVVKQLDPADDTSVFHIFERLNTGGTSLAGQEIRNCVYSGTFTRFLSELNSDANWRAVFGRQTPDKRLRDEELILRFLALHSGWQAYQKTMKDFLSNFMKKNRNATAHQLSEYRDLFKMTVAATREYLGPRPFHIRAGLNTAVFDCVTVAIATGAANGRLPKDLVKRYTGLLADPSFVPLTVSSTTNEDVVKRRMEMATAYLLS